MGLRATTQVAKKGIRDYIMLELRAPDGFYEASVLATAKAMVSRSRVADTSLDDVLKKCRKNMDRLDHMIYFVPQLLSEEEYLKIIKTDPSTYEEVQDFFHDLEGEELLCSLQEYSLYASPKVTRDYAEIGYPAKFQSKILDKEGWVIEKIHRRGAFSRNSVLTDATIVGEICGDAGTSGQRLKRKVLLSNKAEVTQFLKDVTECLPNNPVWDNMISRQMKEAKQDFPEGIVEASIFAPSTGILTLFFLMTQENGILYVPTYSLSVHSDGDIKRVYIGELISTDNHAQSPSVFRSIVKKYYQDEVGLVLMNMGSGGYEARDIDILDDIGLAYGTFCCNIEGLERSFLRIKHDRWKIVDPIQPFGELQRYLDKNDRLLEIIAHKLGPRMRGGIHDMSSSEKILQEAVVASPSLEIKRVNMVSCDICSIPFADEHVISIRPSEEGDNEILLCSDCTLYFSEKLYLSNVQILEKDQEGQFHSLGQLSNNDIIALKL